MTVGLFWYCRQWGLTELARAALHSGFIGGIGFAAASMLKLVEVKSGYETNWHSILEQTTGLFNGIGIAVAVAVLARRTAPRLEESGQNAWNEPVALAFVVLGITYLNARKNVAQWIATSSMPATMAGLPAWVWFDVGYVALTLTMFVLVLRHRRMPLAVLPASALGRGQLFYLALLWAVVAFNFERAIVNFAAQRLVTEGVLYLVALACTIVLLCASERGLVSSAQPVVLRERTSLAATIIVGLLAAALTIFADWAIVPRSARRPSRPSLSTAYSLRPESDDGKMMRWLNWSTGARSRFHRRFKAGAISPGSNGLPRASRQLRQPGQAHA